MTSLRQLRRKRFNFQTIQAKNMSVQSELWSVFCLTSKVNGFLTVYENCWLPPISKRKNDSAHEVRKPIHPDRLPVCAELRTSKRTGVLSWTTLGWVDAAARAAKHRGRTAWWERCSEASLLSSWSMGSEQRRGKGLWGVFMACWSAELMLNCKLKKNFSGRGQIPYVLKSETDLSELK